MTLHLTPVLLRQMIEHCHTEHPREACGVLPGRNGRPEWHVPMRNVSDRPERRFAFDLDDQLAVWQAMDEAGEDPIVIYHSHTASDAVPSATDCAHFQDPAVHYVIVSTLDRAGEQTRVRAWRHDNGVLTEEPVIVTASCG